MLNPSRAPSLSSKDDQPAEPSSPLLAVAVPPPDLASSPADAVVSPYLGSWKKRALDLVVGAILTLLLSPVMVALALLSAISFRSWPLFIQERVGRDGISFRCIKIRSLPVTAPPEADKYAIAASATTRVGRFLRATHLDELPQLLHVLTGRMSLVGPRPEMVALSAAFDPWFLDLRTRVRPGCTGLWQVSADVDRLIREVPEYDVHYVHAATFGNDLGLLWKTVVKVFVGSRSGGSRPVIRSIDVSARG